MGDPGKMILLEKIIGIIQKNRLLENVKSTGEYVLGQLKEMEKEFAPLVHSARGRGTFLAVTADTEAKRDEMIAKLKSKGAIIVKRYKFSNENRYFSAGIICGGAYTHTLRLRPSLLFTKKHADIFLDTLYQVLKEIR